MALWDYKLTLRKRHFFVIEKYIEDVKQEEKDVPDLLESIMKGSGLVKEELRRILFKMDQFRPKITKIRVYTFSDDRKNRRFGQDQPPSTPFRNIWPR